MPKKLLYSILLLTVLSAWGCAPKEDVCTSDGYTLYKPVFFKHSVTSSDIYFTSESRVGSDHNKHIQFVFNHYKIKYKLKGDHVMVDCAVWDDKKFMWNLSLKAEDKLWRETRKVDN